MINEYYILPVALINLLQEEDVVESLETVRYNLAGTKFVCKTKIGVTNPPYMNPNKAYTHAEILVEMAKDEWQNNDV